MNMKFTKEVAFKLAGGYHVTHVGNLVPIIKRGILPGGGSGGRDHVFFGEYAPWGFVNSRTLSYLGGGTEQILILHMSLRHDC